jgi:hypothetical protein
MGWRPGCSWVHENLVPSHFVLFRYFSWVGDPVVFRVISNRNPREPGSIAFISGVNGNLVPSNFGSPTHEKYRRERERERERERKKQSEQESEVGHLVVKPLFCNWVSNQ